MELSLHFIRLINHLSTLPSSPFNHMLLTLNSFYAPPDNLPHNDIVRLFKSRLSNFRRYFTSAILSTLTSPDPPNTILLGISQPLTHTYPLHSSTNIRQASSTTYTLSLDERGLTNGTQVAFHSASDSPPSTSLTTRYPLIPECHTHLIRYLDRSSPHSSLTPDTIIAKGESFDVCTFSSHYSSSPEDKEPSPTNIHTTQPTALISSPFQRPLIILF